jgi:hypothetical protein
VTFADLFASSLKNGLKVDVYSSKHGQLLYLVISDKDETICKFCHKKGHAFKSFMVCL